MPTATWNGTVIAQSDETIEVEGNHYFPPDSLVEEYFMPNNHHTVCGWKGTASYYDIVVDQKVNPRAAWTYPTPKEAASSIAGYVAFWGGVQVEK